MQSRGDISMEIIDPICKKHLKIDEKTPNFSGCGEKTLYFCSDECKKEFERDSRLFHQLCHQ